MFDFEEAAQIDSDPELLNKIFELRDPESEQLNEIFEVEGAAQIDPEQEQLNNGFPERKPLRIGYRDYLNMRRRIAVIEE